MTNVLVMNRLKPIFAIIFCLLAIFRVSLAQEKVRNIAIFFPMNPSMPSYQNFLEGFQSALPAGSDYPTNLIIEYLDITRLRDETYVQHIVEMYNEKLKGNAVDLLITIPPFTYSLLEKYGFEALKTTPTIKVELDPPAEDSVPKGRFGNCTEMKISLRANETLEHAFHLFPSNRDVYIITGSSATDLYFAGLVRKNTVQFLPAHHFTFIDGLPLDSVVQRVRKIPSNGMVFIPIFLSDAKNNPFSTPEAIRLLSVYCKAPIFPMFDSFLKSKGGLGGFVLSYIYVGKEAGRIAVQILNGTKPSEINVNTASFYQYIYDWRELKRWKLTTSDKIPAGSIFYNHDPDFMRDHKWEIVVLIIIFLSETFLIVYLVKLNKRQKEITRQKDEAETLHRELVRQDRIATMAEMTASLSHELNQPLTAILYSAQAGKRFLNNDSLSPDQANEIFDNIIEDDKRAAGLISSVRSMMKLETREKERVNLNMVIQDTVGIFHAESVRQKIQIVLHLYPEPVFVFGDKIQLQQVLLNLMTNAGVAMEHVDADRKMLTIRQVADQKSVVVSVLDSGPGIDPAILERIFMPFVSSHETGFGIGLAVCQSIMVKHGGAIWAENVQDSGAEFSFRLLVV
jgi:signal transduction histidine kinase